ncbi:MAG: hypothetical protein IT457_24855 [Planctomycetes bacterium]|nr:hypothetical protein [Planctomycetota bacterium]
MSSAPTIAVDEHPLFEPGLVLLELDRPLGERHAESRAAALLRHDLPAPLQSDEGVRGAVRDLLRQAGFKPTGRSKPSSEYLLRASEEGRLAPINALVDLGNAVSLHSGLPISVIDLARATPPLRIGVAADDARYVFNASGQEIDVGRLLALHDADGPCANAVKDAQRTKTDASTRVALAIAWGTRALPGRCAAAVAWMLELARADGLGATALAPAYAPRGGSS